MASITIKAAARSDLVAHFVYLAENAGPDIADRFLANAESSFNELANQPLIGAPVPLRDPRLADMRKWRVLNFDKFLIFYVPRDDAVSIIRVLHSAQDWWTLLETTS
jgi:toxin ParE1/3/4